MRKKAPRLIAALAAVLLIALAASAGAEVTMQTKHWEANDQAFSDLAARIREMTDVNLLTHPGVKIVENGGPGVGYAQGIADGEAGRLAGDGRVQVPGAPSVFTFYLGKPRTIREVGMFTANGDARSNQDYEVRLIDNSANPGQKPAFPEKPTFTSGDKVIGGNRGGFHSSFVDDRGGPIVPGKVDWVQFRIWGTYNVAAGEPAKKGGRDWSAVIELEVLVDESDMPMVTREEIQRRRAERARAIARERLQREQKEMAAIFGGAEPLRRAIVHLTDTYGKKYPKGPEYLKRLNQLEAMLEQQVVEGQKLDAGRLKPLADQLAKLREEALLANPLLDFDRLLMVKRKAGGKLGLPQNWQGNCAIAKTGYNNEIAVLSPVTPQGKLTTLFKPEGDRFVGDVDLHFDGDKMIFSMPGSHDRWQIFEIQSDGSGLRQVTEGQYGDVDNYDACYLPDERIIFGSTACFHGVPCVGGGNTVANLFIMDADGGNTRQLCFDQDHNWCPAVLNNGRVLYSRWEYSDSPHYFTRLMFSMNPDGTNQVEYYASNSLWPNSTFYARPIPGHPTKFVGIISGHHGVPRMGEMIIFDPAKGRREADGVVQRIPGYGKTVEPKVADGLVNGSWPKFLHPYPLSENYFLVSAQPTSSSLWGAYLVDTFDNMLLLHEEPGFVMFEPVPFRPTHKPPAVPDRVDLAQRDATVYLTDVYAGPGLKGVPRGTVKNLRVYEFHYAYPRMGGHINIGIDGPWDARRILGTVPIESDGSANFKIPANTPIAVQPLDADGRAVQIMRSWFTGMPGESVSCVGCHDDQNSTPPSKQTLANRRAPSEIEPWYGEARGFGFKREVQPVLDKYCVGCHNPDKKDRPDFTAKDTKGWRNFTPAYIALHPYVRRPGPESDYHLQKPMEFHAGTSELIQMLEKGHHGVKLDTEAWDRLVTWIDLNVPDHGTWGEHRGVAGNLRERRQEMRSLYAHVDHDPEEIAAHETPVVEFVKPQEEPKKPDMPRISGWPFDTAEAAKRQADAGEPAEMEIDLPGGAKMQLVLVPGGEFVMGDTSGAVDEWPAARVKIDKPYYMAKLEISNAEYGLFDPGHDTAVISMTNKDQGSRGHWINGATQPVARVTWQQAMAYCQWLSKETGKKFSLPTEAQWEWACRAGTATPLSFGDLDADFSKFANVADATLNTFAKRDSPKWHPKDERFNDGAMVTTNVGRYQGNAWGLCDMHGNVAEWTRSTYRPYPYDSRDGRDDPNTAGKKTVRGGSWYDRPERCRSAFRMNYHPWQHVYNVGFRVVMEAE